MARSSWMLMLWLCAQSACYAASTTGLCAADEAVVWECPMKAKAVALCASKGPRSAATTMQYRFGKANKIELQFPPTPQTADKFFISSTDYSGGGEYHVRFAIADYEYSLFERTVRTDFSNDGKHSPAMTDGVAIKHKGKIASILNCSKAPDGSISGEYGEFMSKEEFAPFDD